MHARRQSVYLATRRGSSFWPFLTPVVGACHATVTSGLMQRHPGLRIGFIEASGPGSRGSSTTSGVVPRDAGCQSIFSKSSRSLLPVTPRTTSGTLRGRLARACS